MPIQNLWQALRGQRRREVEAVTPVVVVRTHKAVLTTLEIAPDDPLVAHFQHAPNVVEIEQLTLDSPALHRMKTSGVKLVVPLVSQGELIGVLNLGPRLSEQDYSSDDRGLLNNLATQAAPAVRVAQLVRVQQLEAQARERLEQELRVARLIQQTLLPKEVPTFEGWRVAAFYRPARAVGGDFYDFIDLPDGRLALVIGDVTDKGVPAALVMATTRAILRGAAQQLDTPGAVLERANELLCPDIPPKMFVTCLYAILDPASGRLHYANAGHDLPYWRTNSQAVELRATGMPLGLMPGMQYEEKEIALQPGENILFYSDGLVEAHNPHREMFSFPRLQKLVAAHADAPTTIDFLLAELARFTGPEWEQEDDVTLVTLERTSPPIPLSQRSEEEGRAGERSGTEGEGWRILADFTLPSELGNERLAMKRVAESVGALVSTARLERLKTAVAEATMNAIEHGNKFRPELPVTIKVLVSDTQLVVRIADLGDSAVIPDPQTPDLDAKLAGLQSPRGWGLFLIKHLVDAMNIITDGGHHTVELILHLQGDEHDRDQS